jgi:ATP-binding cassette subfamily B multidrug efflux pump
LARNRYDVDEDLKEKFNVHTLKMCAGYIGRYKWQMIAALCLSGIASVVGLAGPLLMQKALDEAIPQKDMNYLVTLCILLAGTILVNIGFNAARTVIVAKVGQNIIFDIRSDLFHHLQELPFSYYDDRPQGKILVRVVQYVNNVSDVMSNGLLNFIIEVLNIVFIVFYMFRISAPLALVTIAGLPVVAAFVMFIKPRQHKAWEEVSNTNSNMNAYIQESIDGVKVSQLFNRQEDSKRKLHVLLKRRYEKWMHAVRVSNTVWVVVGTVSQVVFTMVYIAGAYWMYPMATFGVLLSMGTYASRFWQPILNIGNIYNSFVTAMAYLERIFETMNEPVEVHDLPGATELPPVVGKVEFDHVNFSYDGTRRILDDICLKAEPGESIALVGPTGAGKTTIVNLLSRFYNIEEGKVLIDGHSVMDVTLRSLRSQMGIMLQDSFIFSGTIADNIRYGKPDATDEEVIQAAKTLHADEFIMQMKNGFDTVVQERGGGLSQGQKQLIAFARTLLADPKILVLDEATSSIDSATEKLVQEGIATLLRGRTSFIVAHRLSTIRSCSRILYIDGGKIMESGTHAELMAKRGLYYELTISQYANEAKQTA